MKWRDKIIHVFICSRFFRENAPKAVSSFVSVWLLNCRLPGVFRLHLCYLYEEGSLYSACLVCGVSCTASLLLLPLGANPSTSSGEGVRGDGNKGYVRTERSRGRGKGAARMPDEEGWGGKAAEGTRKTDTARQRGGGGGHNGLHTAGVAEGGQRQRHCSKLGGGEGAGGTKG